MNIMNGCPSFDGCNAPKCPLDIDLDGRSQRLKDEAKCKAYKRTRYCIGREYPNLLPYRGLTKREYQGFLNFYGEKEIWDGLDNRFYNQRG